MNTIRNLMSLGAVAASLPTVRSMGDLTMNDALGWVGLERRRARTIERIALIGAGTLIGAGIAILFAPASGRETRQKLKEGAETMARNAEELSDKAVGSLKDAAQQARNQFEERVPGAGAN